MGPVMDPVAGDGGSRSYSRTAYANPEVHFDYRNLAAISLGISDDKKFITYIIKELLSNRKKIDLTKGEQKRDFVYISDVAAAYEKAIEYSKNVKNGFYEYEIGTGVSTSIEELVLKIRYLTGRNNVKLNFGAVPYVENEYMDRKADSDRIH